MTTRTQSRLPPLLPPAHPTQRIVSEELRSECSKLLFFESCLIPPRYLQENSSDSSEDNRRVIQSTKVKVSHNLPVNRTNTS